MLSDCLFRSLTEPLHEEHLDVHDVGLRLNSPSSADSNFVLQDDHNLKNDYDEGTDTPLYGHARAAFDDYVAPHNPASPSPVAIYYTFTVGEVDFFVLDTRSYRSRNR